MKTPENNESTRSSAGQSIGFLKRRRDAETCPASHNPPSPSPTLPDQSEVSDAAVAQMQPRFVDGFNAYRVFADGTIQSRWRSQTRSDAWRSLRPCHRGDDGYAIVYLCDGRGTQKRFYLHRLVALLFIGEPPAPRSQIRHLDGNPRNNSAANLAWGTQAENENDKIRHGTFKNLTSAAKLTADQVREIRTLAPSQSQTSLASKFSVSRATITRILNGSTWGHVA